MTNLARENRESKKKSERRFLIALLVFFLLSYSMGFLSHWSVCRVNHHSKQDNVQKVELSGSATIYYVLKTEDKEEPEDPVLDAKEEEEEFVSYYTYTDDELDLLSRLIESEGGNESYETKLKIGSVVMNRVTEEVNFPDTIREVIYEKNQFAVTTTKIDGVLMIDRPASEESKRAAKEVLDYGSVLPLDVQVFYAKGCKEKWVTSREVYDTFGKTVFAYIYAG